MQTIKVADSDAIYNRISSDSAAYTKLVKAAAKAGEHDYWFLIAKLVKKIGYGAIKIDGWWYPVVNGVCIRNGGRNSYQFSTAAVSDMALQSGNVKFDLNRQFVAVDF